MREGPQAPKVSPAKIAACSDNFSLSLAISHSLLQALEACLGPIVMLVGEEVRRLRDNEAGLVQLGCLKGNEGARMSEAEGRELAGALAVNTTLTKLDLYGNRLGEEGGRAMGEALAVNTTLKKLDLHGNALGEEGWRAMGEALAVNTTLSQLNLCRNALGEEGGRAMGESLAVNTTLTQLDLGSNMFGPAGASAIAQALALNKTLTSLDLRFNCIGDKGVRKIAKALQVNHVLTAMRLAERQGLDVGLLDEVDRFVAVNRALDSKLVAVMMSMHARLGAESGLRVLDQNLVWTMCDMFCRESKASCLLDDV